MTQNGNNSSQPTRPAFLPANASWQSAGEVEGWMYTLCDPYGERYVFFLWSDGGGYAVSLVDPPLERDPSATELKIQPDGRLGPFAPGQPMTFLTAFQMSIAWMAFRSIDQRMVFAESV
jgi:hypothetical protein